MTTLSPEVLSGLRERIEPCPFCGGAVELTSSKTLGDRLFCIKCPDDSPCVGSGLGIYVVAGQVETAIAAWNRRAALDLSPPVVEEGLTSRLAAWFNALPDGGMGKEHFDALLAIVGASPVPKPQAVAWRYRSRFRTGDWLLTNNSTLATAEEAQGNEVEPLAPLSGGGKVEVTNGVVDAQWQWLCDKDDRSSPVEYPDMALVTRDELGEIITAALSTMGGKRP